MNIALNSLRFGDLEVSNTRRLLKGVMQGIGGYGNAFGVSAVGLRSLPGVALFRTFSPLPPVGFYQPLLS